MNTWILLVVGLVTGAAVGWLWANSKIRTQQLEAEGKIKAAESTVTELRGQVLDVRSTLENLQDKLKAEGELRVAAETRLKEARTNLEEQKKMLDEARQKLADAFSALAAEALKSNNETFIALAKSTFETIQAHAKGDLETRQKAIDTLIGPLKESLDRYEHQILEMEKGRQKAYGTLEEQLRSLAQANQKLQEETSHLATALSSPLKVRGRWGELTLRRVAELAGMSEHCDFTEQETIATESGPQRPDMIVNLPGSRRIAVDAKVPLQAFMDAVDPERSADERRAALASHGKLVRDHMNQLAERRYWEQIGPELELVVLFLPGESFFSAALEQDRALIEDGMQKKVVLATPTTLIALLRSAAYLWQQEKITQNARRISDLGKELHDRLRSFVGHFQTLGSTIERAVDSYNKAVGSFESRVLPSARKFRELGAATGDQIVEVEPVDEMPRALTAPEREEAG
jgi:DNA recombination protein RmuC